MIEKVVICTGSFNPITKGHALMMKCAIDTISADRGLFFITPNQYLGYKMHIKKKSNFILSDEVRIKMIEALNNEYNNILLNFKGGKSLHAPFWDLNLGSKNKDVRDATMKAFNYAYDVAKQLGCTEIVVHNGFVPNTSFYEGWVRNAVSFWKEFFLDKDDSITMLSENQCEEDSEVLKMEIDSVNDPRLKVCLDIGHAHANSNMPVEEWISTLGDRIGYLHLHNNHGKVSGRPSFKNDEHLGLENGTIRNDINIKVVRFFAYLHDKCRLDDWDDLEHGVRAADMLSTLKDTVLKDFTDEEIMLLEKACRYHTTVQRTGIPTVDVCFDADRLDLGRVGIVPNPMLMATEQGAYYAVNIHLIECDNE